MVYAKWDESNLWYPAQVISIHEGHYNVYFMDGYAKEDVPESEIREIPRGVKTRHTNVIGKKFYDDGSVKDGETPIKAGVFVVLCYQPGNRGSTPNYWCERVCDTIVEKRDISEFDCKYVRELVKKYESSV